MNAPSDLPAGLYERLVTQELAHVLEPLGGVAALDRLDPADAHLALARHERLAARVLRDLPRLARDAQATLTHVDGLRDASARSFDGQGRRRGFSAAPTPGNPRSTGLPGWPPAPRTPHIPLSASALLVNARGEPGVGGEVNRELASADDVDLLIPFVRWTGVRIVKDHLGEVVRRGGRVRAIAFDLPWLDPSRAPSRP